MQIAHFFVQSAQCEQPESCRFHFRSDALDDKLGDKLAKNNVEALNTDFPFGVCDVSAGSGQTVLPEAIASTNSPNKAKE
jgi:hypothetical protein